MIQIDYKNELNNMFIYFISIKFFGSVNISESLLLVLLFYYYY